MTRARWMVAGPVLLIAAWAAGSALGLLNPVLVPGPLAVALELGRLASGPLWPDVGVTLARAVGGFALGSALGIPAGLWLGSAPRLEGALAVPLDLYRSVPAVALIPLFVVLLGIGEASKLAVAVGAVLPIVLVSTSYGVRSGRRTRRLLVQSLGMTRAQALRLVVFPEALPHVFAGLRLGISAATTVAVAAEMFLGAGAGLGRRIADAQLFFRVPELFATVLVAGALGVGLNRLVLAAEHRALHWVGR